MTTPSGLLSIVLPMTTWLPDLTRPRFARQVPDLDAVLVATSGGGMISGIATAVKELRPECKGQGSPRGVQKPWGGGMVRRGLL